MKLFLASEAKHPLSVEKLKDFVGGFEGKTIGYIPTAANAQGYGSWKDGGSWSLVQTLGATVSLVVLEECSTDQVYEKLSGKNIIWFAGGQCGYLMYWIRRRALDKRIRELLGSGSIYVGSSAGSMVASPSLGVVDWYYGEEEAGASIIPSLNLVDFDIYPHYEDHLLGYVKENYKGNKLYLLKNGEEILVDGDNITVVGEERILSMK